ncbi:MAG: NAD-dependent epimerase/dehydratase family protein [Alteraurantiacibacter sp.]
MGQTLVTGATGGLGSALLVEAQRRGASLRGTSRSRREAQGVDFVRIEFADPHADYAALVEGCDTVIHSAALSDSWGGAAKFDATNVKATRRLLDAARSAGVRHFVVVSSPSIFARFEDQTRIGEHHPPNEQPLNHYARTKLAAERDVLGAGGSDMATCAIRPRAMVGHGDRVILPRLIEIAHRKRIPLPRGGRAMIELTDIRDAAWAICEAAERCRTINGRAINISGGRPLAVGELARRVAEVLGTQPKLVDLPLGPAHGLAATLEGAAKLLGLKEPPLTRYTLSTLGYSQTFDLEPAKRLLGYEPRYDAVETILSEARKAAA